MPTYKVERKDQQPRVVDAPNPAAARQHVARSEISVSKISASDAFKLAQAGVTLETAGAETELSQEPQPVGSIGEAGAGQDVNEHGDKLGDEQDEVK